MTIVQSVMTILAVVAGTALTRFLPFLIFPEGKNPPDYITWLGTVLPPAVIGLLIVYCLKDAVFSAYHGLPEIISIGFIYLLHKWKKNTLLSIAWELFSIWFLCSTSLYHKKIFRRFSKWKRKCQERKRGNY